MKHDLSRWLALPGAEWVVAATDEGRILYRTDGLPDRGVCCMEDGKRIVVWEEGEDDTHPDADSVDADGTVSRWLRVLPVPS